mgnify:CR=1 FL=1
MLSSLLAETNKNLSAGSLIQTQAGKQTEMSVLLDERGGTFINSLVNAQLLPLYASHERMAPYPQRNAMPV